MSSTVPLILEEDCERGGKQYDESIEDDFAYRNNVANANKEIRLGFIRKVYGILSMQLLITAIVASICMFVPPITEFIHNNAWMMMACLLINLPVLIALHFNRHKTPTNFILLTIFTVIEAYTVAVFLTFFSKIVVLEAVILTLIVVAGLTLYTFQTEHDFSSMYSGLFAGLCILIVGGFLQIFFVSSVLEIVLGLGGAFLFCLFIIFDTQTMMEKLSAEEYILATINLYMDIINLFLHILRILQAINNN